MARSILSAPVWLIGILLVVVLPAVVIGIQLGVRRRWPGLVEGDHNDVVGFIIAVVGVIYAVLLAFVVIVAWETFDEAEGVVGQEASALRSMQRDSIGLPTQAQDPLQDLVREYATRVIDEEWPAMAAGEPGDPAVGDIFDDMARTISGAEVTTPSQQEFVGAETEQLNQLVSLRSQRLDFVDSGIPGVLWLALIVGAVVTVGFAVLFGIERTGLQLVMVGSLAVLVGVILLVAAAFNYPFAGDMHVGPEPFERVLVDFGGAAGQSPADGD
jgi:hypothetical protein